MAKKSSTQPESKPLTTAAKKPVKPKASKAAKSSAPAVAEPAAARPAVKKKKKQPTAEEIQLRAYFISENRQKLGLPGDSESDWIEAERQLLAEIPAKPIL